MAPYTIITKKIYDTVDQAIEGMLRSTGEWVTLQTWQSADQKFYARDWLIEWGERVGQSSAPLPLLGHVDLTAFCAVREAKRKR